MNVQKERSVHLVNQDYLSALRVRMTALSSVKPRAAVVAATLLLIASPVGAQSLGGSRLDVRLLTEMVGDWDVNQQMWTGPNQAPVTLPAAIARRTLAAGGGFIEEAMTLANPGTGEPFQRTAHLNYNSVDGVFEYFSIDSRAPQQMHYQSPPMDATTIEPLNFEGGTFVAGQWGEKRNLAFRYRVKLSAVSNNEQMLQLFLRPLEAGGASEFKAFEYRYKRRSPAG